MEILIIILLLANLLLTFLLWQSRTQQKKDVQEILEAQADHLSDQLDYRLEQERQNSLLQQKNLEIGLGDRFSSLHTSLHRDLTDLRTEISDNLTKNRDKTDERMKQIQESNELRLEQMRQTVEEKLEKDSSDSPSDLF